jgi:hypothetical protein
MFDALGRLTRLAAIGCVSAVIAGCSISNPTDNPFTVTPDAYGKPTVWDCSVVVMSSPPRYACGNNKTYTAFQLRDARLGLTSAQAAGKL